jgi:hypothetical protein
MSDGSIALSRSFPKAKSQVTKRTKAAIERLAKPRIVAKPHVFEFKREKRLMAGEYFIRTHASIPTFSGRSIALDFQARK